MDNLAIRYNRMLMVIFTISPFAAFCTLYLLNVDFVWLMQFLSWIGLVLLLLLRNRRNPIKFPIYLWFYFLFVLFVFYSDLIRLNREFKLIYLFSNTLVGSFNIMFIIENISIPKYKFERIIRTSRYILVIAFIVIVIQQGINPNFFVHITHAEEDVFIPRSDIRLPSIYSWISGLAYGFGFIPVFMLVVEDLEKRNKKILIWIVIGILYAFFTKGRWAMINVLLVFVILLINHRNKVLQFLKFLFIIPFIFIVIFLGLKVAKMDVTYIIEERILESNRGNINQTSAGTRILAYNAFNHLFWDHPFLGTGNIKYGMGGTGKHDYKLRSFLKDRSSQIHVGYLSLFYTYGLIGGFLFLIFLFLILYKLYKNAKLMGRWGPFIGFLGFGLANFTLVTYSVFEMGLIIVLLADNYYFLQYSQKTKEIV